MKKQISITCIVFISINLSVFYAKNKIHLSDAQYQETNRTLKAAISPTHAPTANLLETSELRAPEPTLLIDINAADEKNLQTLPNIGPKRSASIIKYRQRLPSQHFTDIEQLLGVPGINQKSLDNLKAYIFIEKIK